MRDVVEQGKDQGLFWYLRNKETTTRHTKFMMLARPSPFISFLVVVGVVVVYVSLIIALNAVYGRGVVLLIPASEVSSASSPSFLGAFTSFYSCLPAGEGKRRGGQAKPHAMNENPCTRGCCVPSPFIISLMHSIIYVLDDD